MKNRFSLVLVGPFSLVWAQSACALSTEPASAVLPKVEIEAQSVNESGRLTQSTDSLQQKASGETLGDYLQSLPNVDSASYGPAVGRPVVRGMSGYRVQILQNDQPISDLSAMSQDHAVGINAKTAQRIELLKGPASLLYGAHAGGVVRVEDALAQGFPQPGVQGELEASTNRNSAAKNWAAKLQAGGERFALQWSGVAQQADDYQAADRQKIADSDLTNRQMQLGLNYRLAPQQWVQLYGSRLYKDYGIPNQTAEATRIEMDRELFGIRWQAEAFHPYLDKLSVEVQRSDYLHLETEGESVDGRFGQRQDRLTLSADYSLDAWWGSTRLSLLDSALNVCHEHGRCQTFREAERTGAPLGESLEQYLLNTGRPYSHGHPMPDTQTQAVQWALNGQREMGSWGQLELGANLEYRALRANPANIQETWVYPEGLDANYYQTERDYAVSFSAAWRKALLPELQSELSLSYLQRLPSVDELYWNGFHHATDSYIFGNRDLEIEQSFNVDWDLTWSHASGDWQLSLFYAYFWDYIYQTIAYDAYGQALSDPFHQSEVWTTEQEDARIYGGSISHRFALIELAKTPLQLTNQVDGLQAKRRNGENLPRTAPLSWQLGLSYQPARWSAQLMAKRVFRATHLADNESSTPGYTWLSAYLDWQAPRQYGQWTLWLKGDNLLDSDACNHLSFLKERAPLMGRNLSAGVRLVF